MEKEISSYLARIHNIFYFFLQKFYPKDGLKKCKEVCPILIEILRKKFNLPFGQWGEKKDHLELIIAKYVESGYQRLHCCLLLYLEGNIYWIDPTYGQFDHRGLNIRFERLMARTRKEAWEELRGKSIEEYTILDKGFEEVAIVLQDLQRGDLSSFQKELVKGEEIFKWVEEAKEVEDYIFSDFDDEGNGFVELVSKGNRFVINTEGLIDCYSSFSQDSLREISGAEIEKFWEALNRYLSDRPSNENLKVLEKKLKNFQIQKEG